METTGHQKAQKAQQVDVNLQFKLHRVQRELFENPSRFRIAAWGRRTGKNVVANADQVAYGVDPNSSQWGGGSGDDLTLWWVSTSYRQAKKYGFDVALKMIPDVLLDGKPKRSPPYEIRIRNGETTATFEYLSADNPDSLDGAGVDHLVIDEHAQTPPDIWNEKTRPMLSDTLGQAVIISKPKGKNQFYDFFQRGQSDDPDWSEWWSSHATGYDNPWVPDSEIDKAARGLPDKIFQQEYLAIFHDSGGGVFPGVRDRNVVAYDWRERNGNGPYTHGWDFARHQNWTVGITLDRDGLLVNFERLQPPSWPTLQRKIEAVYGQYPGVVRVDASRDNKLVTDLEDAGVPVEAVTFTTQTKREMVDNLAVRLENGELTLPEIDQLLTELELFEYDVTPAGNVRYHAPEGWHDDCVDALALAAKEGRQPTTATWGSS